MFCGRCTRDYACISCNLSQDLLNVYTIGVKLIMLRMYSDFTEFVCKEYILEYTNAGVRSGHES